MKFNRFLFVLFLTAVLFTGCSQNDDTSGTLYSELKSVNKLILARMSISKMATIDDIDLDKAKGLKQTSAALLDALKIGDRKAAYSYDTYLRAYIDMMEFQPEDIVVNDDDKTISITLPEIRTEFAGRDAAIREEHYRVTGLRSAVNPRERAEMKEEMNMALKKEVESNPVYKEKIETVAKSKGEAWFRAVAARDGYSVSVEFK